MTFDRRKLFQSIAVLACAYSLKAYYSAASVNELRWILAPTASAVELCSGARFTFEPFAGYMNDERTFLIASSCSGVNFLIAAFLVLALGRIIGSADRKVAWTFLAIAPFAAYLVTIAANTVRICLALRIREPNSERFGLNAEQLHRFEGIVIYFAFLLFVFLFSDRWKAGSLSSGQRLRSLGLPLVVYYATTLGIPVINSIIIQAPLKIEFREHMFFVLIIPIALTIILLFAKKIGDLISSKRIDIA